MYYRYMSKRTAYQISVTPTKAFEIKANGKYLLILNEDAQIQRVATAIGKFFKPSQFFVLAVRDVNQVKLTELLLEEE